MFVDPICEALIYFATGDMDNFERQLKAMIEQHGAYANVENLMGPYLDTLIDQPRFQLLFREFRIPSSPKP